MKKTRYGILGTGRIARSFSDAVNYTDCAEVVAVGSRTAESADIFADDYNLKPEHAYGSYEELVNCDEVDIVYIATPNNLHYENSMLALKAGKGVLCEKPLTLNAREAKELIEYARANNLFFCDAMWSRFFPVALKVRDWLENGVIGDIRLVTVNFGFNAPVSNESRLFAPELGGGALLDIGVYTIAFATMAFGCKEPLEVVGTSYICETGVDTVTTTILKYETGLAALNCGLVTNMRNSAMIYGQNGRIEIHDGFWAPRRAELIIGRNEAEVIECPHECNGYEYEVREVARCLNEGLLESPYMTHEDSINVMTIMDKVRERTGLKYPNEN